MNSDKDTTDDGTQPDGSVAQTGKPALRTASTLQRFNVLTLQRTHFPQHCLYFLPLPHGHGSLRPTLGPVRLGTGFCFETSSAAWLTMSLAPGLGASGLEAVPSAALGSCLVSRGALRKKFSKAIRLDALRNVLWQISV